MAKPPSQQQQQQQQQLQYQFQQQQLFLHETNPNPNQSTTATAEIQRQPTRKRQYNGGRKKAEEGVGEIVEVQGGHIIRSTGRKDRHSKVCTAKGPRDRRVRLSAHTAIQFYDVQDRLGYDRPSKAVDWLLKKAQSSINELDELPPWKPSATNTKTLAAEEEGGGGAMYADNNDESTSLLPPSLDSDSPVQFQSYQSQDLKLSLQSQTHYRNQEEDHQIGFNSSAWDLGGVSYSGSRFMSIPPPLLFGQAAATNHFLSQRGTLQSNNNNTPLVTATDDDHHPLSFSGIGFASSGAGFSTFSIPGRYQGDREEEQDANVSNNQSSGSRH